MENTDVGGHQIGRIPNKNNYTDFAGQTTRNS
jgi:hypothetical protein